VIDSGASAHFTGDLSLFVGVISPSSLRIDGISGGLVATGVGRGRVLIAGVQFHLSRLYYVPGLATSLISMSELVESGCTISTRKVHGTHEMSVTNSAGHVATIHPRNGLYECDSAAPAASAAPAPPASAFLSLDGVSVGRTHVGDIPLGDLLHRRFGHPSWQSKLFADRVRKATGKCTLGHGHSVASCDACARTKIRQQFNRSAPTRPATRPLEHIHFDYVPQISVRGVGGYTGFVLLVDEFTGMLFVYLIRSKSEILDILSTFRKEAERHFRQRMGTVSWPLELASIRSDGEAVNVSHAIKAWCAEHGIARQVSAPYAQWQNGVVERAVQTVWQGAQAMRVAANAPASSWVFAVLAFVHTRNLLAMGEHPLSPWERWWMVEVPLMERAARLRVWGTLCYRYIPPSLRSRLGEKGEPCVFLGYSSVSKAYVLRSLITGAIITDANVVFNESVYPHHAPSLGAYLTSQNLPADYFSDFDTLDEADSSGVSVVTSPLAVPAVPFAAPVPLSALPVRAADAGPSDSPLGDLGLPPPLESPTLSVSVPLVTTAAASTLHPSSFERMVAGLPPPFVPAISSRPSSGRVRKAPSFFDEVGAYAPPAPAPPPLPLPAEEPAYPPMTARQLASVRVAVVKRLQSVLPAIVEESPSGLEGEPSPALPASSPPSRTALLAAMLVVPPLPPSVVRATGELVVPVVDLRKAHERYALCRRLANPTTTPTQLAKLRVSAARHVAVVDSSGGGDDEDADRGLNLGSPRAPRAAPSLTVAAPISAAAMLSQLNASRSAAPTTPLTMDAALRDVNHEGWMEAVADELKSMDEFGVWELVSPPPGCRPLGNKWVFKIKLDKHGIVERLKARLTLQGFRMREGRDYGETWAPTGRLRTLRALLAEASGDSSFKTAQWDCTCAFLHAYLDRPVYMKQPPGTAKPGQEDYVCRLVKAIYGTKQASHLFGKLVETTLIGFNDAASGLVVARSRADDCLFLVSRGAERMRVLTHCDDFAVTHNSDALYDTVFTQMQKVFKITDYGRKPISFYCGLGIRQAPDGSYEISQEGYIREILERFGMTTCKPAESPEKTGAKAKLRPLDRALTPAEASFMQQVPYREAVGAIWYIARATRFDIFRATQEVARFVSNPGPEHWQAVERLLRYLSKTAARPLVYRPGLFSDPKLHSPGLDAHVVGHSDSDWAGDLDTSKSRTGWMVHFGGCLVSWRSVVQSSVAQSSCEAEYIAAGALANEIVWWRLLCNDLGHAMVGASPIRCDSEAAVGMAKHAGKFEATKHVRVKYHVLREYQQERLVQTVWCPSAHQYADVLTKNVAVHTFKRVVDLMLGRQHTAGVPSVAAAMA
jgi:transposase InsO family protein